MSEFFQWKLVWEFSIKLLIKTLNLKHPNIYCWDALIAKFFKI